MNEPTKDECLEFVQAKIIEAEQALKSREDTQAAYLEGTNESWNAAANLHHSTAGRKSTKADRIKESATHGRIAAKCRREVEMLKAVLKYLRSE